MSDQLPAVSNVSSYFSESEPSPASFFDTLSPIESSEKSKNSRKYSEHFTHDEHYDQENLDNPRENMHRQSEDGIGALSDSITALDLSNDDVLSKQESRKSPNTDLATQMIDSINLDIQAEPKILSESFSLETDAIKNKEVNKVVDDETNYVHVEDGEIYKSFSDENNDRGERKSTKIVVQPLENENIETVSSEMASETSASHNVEFAATPPLLSTIATPPIVSSAFSAKNFLQDSDLKSNTSFLSESEAAWIPNEIAQNVFASIASDPNFTPLNDTLCHPNIVIQEQQNDPVEGLLLKLAGFEELCNRKVLKLEEVSQDQAGLEMLMNHESWRSAINLTTKLLANKNSNSGGFSESAAPKISSYSLQLWLTRFALMMKLKLHSHAACEMHLFSSLEAPNLYYQFYLDERATSKQGSMVPFALRLLHASLPQFLGKSQDSLDRFHYILAMIDKMLENLRAGLSEIGSTAVNEERKQVGLNLWMERRRTTLYWILNCLVSMREIDGAVSLLEELLKLEPNNHQIRLTAARFFVLIGDLKMAGKHLDLVSVKEEFNPLSKSNLLVNKGFIAIGDNDFEAAYDHFKEAVALNPQNFVAINNLSVCLLYQGKLSEALNVLEDLILQDPDKHLQESLVFNLCTLYELESSHAHGKKLALLRLVAKHKGDGFDVSCLKL